MRNLKGKEKEKCSRLKNKELTDVKKRGSQHIQAYSKSVHTLHEMREVETSQVKATIQTPIDKSEFTKSAAKKIPLQTIQVIWEAEQSNEEVHNIMPTAQNNLLSSNENGLEHEMDDAGELSSTQTVSLQILPNEPDHEIFNVREVSERLSTRKIGPPVAPKPQLTITAKALPVFSKDELTNMTDKQSTKNNLAMILCPAYFGDAALDLASLFQEKSDVYILKNNEGDENIINLCFKAGNEHQLMNIVVTEEEYLLQIDERTQITGRLLSNVIEDCKKYIQVGSPLINPYCVLTRREDLCRFANVKRISLSEVDLYETFSKGNFSEVIRGSYQKKILALKKIPQLSKLSVVGAMEVAVLFNLEHKNIVHMRSWAIEDDALYIIMDMVFGGTLKTYLQICRKKGKNVKILEIVAKGIAAGMSYLESNGLVHRDLAARNVFLDLNYVPKVGDFGLSFLEHVNYFVPSFALRWTAIEVLRSQYNFSSKSDVWSFGVVLWEMCSLEELPYRDIKNENLLQILENGLRLEVPLRTPKYIKKVMLLCWHKDSNKRPNFNHIKQIFEKATGSVKSRSRRSSSIT